MLKLENSLPTKSDYNLLYSSEQIAKRVNALGEEISKWASSYSLEQSAQENNHQILALCILRGGFIFFADLLRKINCSVEPHFHRVSSYAQNKKTSQVIENFSQQIPNVSKRAVLIVDDICDTGETLFAVKNSLIRSDALEVKTVALINRPSNRKVNFTPDWIGFEYLGEEWIVGYGMEDQNLNSNLPAIYTLKTA